LYAISKSTTLKSNKSLIGLLQRALSNHIIPIQSG
jgi:hypothetical protein